MRARRGDDSTTFLDFLFLLLLVIILLVNDPVPPTKADTPPPGNLVLTVVWPEGDTDCDLWVVGPGEPRPVGYSNKTGKEWSLLRDDLGNKNDSMPLNLENAYSRSVNAGRYIINLHLYRGDGPITVNLEVRLSNMNGGKSSVLATTTVVLHQRGQEVTAIAFDLTADGKVVPGSMNNVFVPLRSEWKQ